MPPHHFHFDLGGTIATHFLLWFTFTGYYYCIIPQERPLECGAGGKSPCQRRDRQPGHPARLHSAYLEHGKGAGLEGGGGGGHGPAEERLLDRVAD